MLRSSLLVLLMIVFTVILTGGCETNTKDHAANIPNNPGGGGPSGDDDNDDVSPDDDTSSDDDDNSPEAAFTVGYIYNGDENVSSFQTLLTPYDIGYTPILEMDVLTTDFTGIDVLLVDSNTEWFDLEAVIAIRDLGLPILGLYYGAGILFDYLDLNIGWTDAFQETGVKQAIVMASTHKVFNDPIDLKVANLDKLTLDAVGTNLNYHDVMDPPAGVFVLLERPVDSGYSVLTVENDLYIYWGLDSTPLTMTQTAADLMANCLYYLSTRIE